MKRYTILITLLSILASGATAKINDKFMAKATEEVWNMEMPAFDPNTEIPDSISENQSAVIIAFSVLLDADHTIGVSASKGRNLGNTNTNIIKRKVIRRYMVKLLDDAGVEDFSSVDLTGGNKAKINNYEMAKTDEAFGARIYKPSGEVIDVDVSKALSVTAGKKGKEEIGRKLAIPSLAVGDVLEFFSYEYEEMDEFSPDPVRIVPFQRYPVMNMSINGVFNPNLTVEYRTVNDAPLLQTAFDEKGNLTITGEFENLEAMPSIPWFARERQIPFYRFVTLNNLSPMVWHSKLARKPGLYPDIPAATYYQEAGEIMQKITPNEQLIKAVEHYIKSYKKTHPDTPKRQLIERAWVATLYYYMTMDDVKASDLGLSLAYREALRKLKLDDGRTGVGFINGRNDIPTDCLLSYSDLDYMPVVGDTIYMATSYTAFAPGELKGTYQGETGGVFYSDFRVKEGDKPIMPQALTAPTTKVNNNVYYSEATVDINTSDEDYPATYSRVITASGTAKDYINWPVYTATWAAEAEDYLEIPERDRYKGTEAAAKSQKEDMDEAMLDIEENSFGIRPSAVTSSEIQSLGCFPGKKQRMYQVEGKIEGLVTDAGDGELIVDIGKLFGQNQKLTSSERKRNTSAVLPSPMQYIYTLHFNVPDGYKIDEESLTALDTNIKNQIGSYTVQTNSSEDGKDVTISVIERHNVYVVPVEYWNDFLEIVDAASNFNGVSLVLSPLE